MTRTYIVTVFLIDPKRYETMVFTGKRSIKEVADDLQKQYKNLAIHYIYCE